MNDTVDTADRVRSSSSQAVNRHIDREIEARVRRYAARGKEDITRRLWELDREWDIERVLETNASVLAFTGLYLGRKYDRRWFVLPSIVLPFLFQHAIQGWCPPVPILRRFGVRTRQEIDREKYALKILRGDFDQSKVGDRAEAALAAVRK